MIVGHWMRPYRDEIVHHIGQLIRIRSVMEPAMPGMPYGEGVDRALTYMLELSASFGFEVKRVDGYAGHAEYGNGDDIVAVLVHLDTVDEGDGWTYPPFGGEIHDGRIYGRGASDDKGPAVVALYALRALKDNGLMPNKRIRIIFGTNEESGMRDMDYYFAREPLPKLAFTPDAGYPIFHVELGNMNVKFTLPGGATVAEEAAEVAEAAISEAKLPIVSLEAGSMRTLMPSSCTAVVSTAHLSEAKLALLEENAEAAPNISVADRGQGMLTLAAGNVVTEGVPIGTGNALANMAAFLVSLECPTNLDAMLRLVHGSLAADMTGEALGIACDDQVSGPLVLFLRMAEWQESGESYVLCNIRYPVTRRGDDLIAQLDRTARQYGMELTVPRHLRPVYVPDDHPVIVRLSRAYEKITGESAYLLRMGAGTYARKLAGNGVAFGAGLPGGVNTNVHAADEFVGIDDMMRHAEICLQGLYELAYAND